MTRSAGSAEFPESVKHLSKEECARILRRALSRSPHVETQVDVAKATGLNPRTVAHYFTAHHKPSQSKWEKLLGLFVGEHQDSPGKSESPTTEDHAAVRASMRIKALVFLLKDDLQFFKNSSTNSREILKQHLPGSEAGYLAGLLTALYDEDHLEAFKVFSSSRAEGSEEEEASDR